MNVSRPSKQSRRVFTVVSVVEHAAPSVHPHSPLPHVQYDGFEPAPLAASVSVTLSDLPGN